jgi:hypothetical protein
LTHQSRAPFPAGSAARTLRAFHPAAYRHHQPAPGLPRCSVGHRENRYAARAAARPRRGSGYGTRPQTPAHHNARMTLRFAISSDGCKAFDRKPGR